MNLIRAVLVALACPLCVPLVAQDKTKALCVKGKKPCSACKYYDWEWDDYIGFREVCYNIGNCKFKQTERSE